jgi:hypothetical protein
MMKIFRLIALFLTTTISFSQNSFSEKEYIANSEKSSAAKLMNLAVNPNTQNYNVIYHSLI